MNERRGASNWRDNTASQNMFWNIFFVHHIFTAALSMDLLPLFASRSTCGVAVARSIRERVAAHSPTDLCHQRSIPSIWRITGRLAFTIFDEEPTWPPQAENR
jgi:hypothetical protein